AERDEGRPGALLKSGAALALGQVAAADDAPADGHQIRRGSSAGVCWKSMNAAATAARSWTAAGCTARTTRPRRSALPDAGAAMMLGRSSIISSGVLGSSRRSARKSTPDREMFSVRPGHHDSSPGLRYRIAIGMA